MSKSAIGPRNGFGQMRQAIESRSATITRMRNGESIFLNRGCYGYACMVSASGSGSEVRMPQAKIEIMAVQRMI